MNSLSETDSHFIPTLQRMRQSVPRSWEYQDVTSPNFARLESSHGATLTFEDHLFRGRFSWRMVHLQTPRAEMLNILLFPEPEVIVPIFVCELMTFTAKPVVGVIDLAPIDRTTLLDAKVILEAAHEQFHDLSNAEDQPDWYDDCRSGHDFFVRPQDFTQLSRVQSATEFVWNRILLAHARVITRPRYPHTSDQVANYKAHHLAHNPGRPFLHRLFGEALTEQFLSEHLYR